ncbi:MAG: hypothetical protein ACI9UU_003807, partial [Candidatus Azotimanducaceae bacterium]
GKTEADVHVLRDQGVLLEDEQTLGKR